MGIQASTIKTAAGKLAFEPKKKGSKVERVRIDILAFEVANVMSKSVQLWQSLSDQEVCRLRGEVIKSEGVLNLVSDNESVLLSLACMEKLQDLTAVALAVSRLGKRCKEAALVGFEHIYNDILKHNIDIRELEFPQKEIEAKVKKMERYICTTSNLYQELEILAEMEQAFRRMQEEDDPGQKDNIYALEQKIVWQRQEIKYLKEISLWNRTYDKIVGMLARCVCTLYGRIIRVFGVPAVGWPQLLSAPRGEADFSGSITSCLSVEEPKLSNGSLNGSLSPIRPGRSSSVALPLQADLEPYLVNRLPGSSPVFSGMRAQSVNASSSSSHLISLAHQSAESYMPLSLCFSPGRQFGQQRSMSANYASRTDESLGSSPLEAPIPDDFTSRSRDSETVYPNGDSVHPYVSPGANKFLFDPKLRLQNAPPSTLGGCALALHYANAVIIVEKMVRYPHLISQEARDDLYHMLPKNVRMALRARLRACMRMCASPDCDEEGVADWKETLERVLGWLAPLAHNMIRWQSEHNFEQQQVLPRTNVLLLQTLYFADQAKAEAAIVELLVGLNYLWRHDRDLRANSLMEYASNRDLDEYLEWQL
ncbi:hypothetical protein GOP47_0006678 [Adiantum capillus-veneris]|uniref:DUF668 domain-containing protein n=1 Tax=Adiantum capillus-veneris TaxID=13818 RepID=A0A9D4V438_ADICA|nr:hypothetical protein GOP47_0006678 [Adiantum capillus-veneris]